MTKTSVAERPIVDSLYSFEKTRPGAPAFDFAADGASLIMAGDVALLEGDVAYDLAGGRVQLPELVAGHDYVIRHADGYLEAVEATDAALADASTVGGFHFALGGNAAGRAGGDTAPAINPASIWDVSFLPACHDPRGMAYVAGVPGSEHVAPFWVDLYLLNVDHLARGTSVAGAEIAEGRERRPKLADGKQAVNLNYTTAAAIMAAHGKGLLSLAEFWAAAYGVTEKTATGSKPERTALDMPRTSRCGMMQAAGNLYVWGHDGDPDVRRAAIFGGGWVGGEFAGSRCAYVDLWPASSYGWIGARGRSDHLQLD
jgi:hypothetical protein